MSTEPTWTADEMMTVAASRALRDGAVLLRRHRAAQHRGQPGPPHPRPRPRAGLRVRRLGAKPDPLPLSIGDGVLAETADAVVCVPEIFNYWLQPGRIDVGFLGAAQIDRCGNINTTVIGPIRRPQGATARRGRGTRDRRLLRRGGRGRPAEPARVRRPGRLRHLGRLRRRTRRPGAARSAGQRARSGHHRPGRAASRTGPACELILTHLHPGVTLDQVRAATGLGAGGRTATVQHHAAAERAGADGAAAPRDDEGPAMSDVYVVDAVRTPIGRYGGGARPASGPTTWPRRGARAGRAHAAGLDPAAHRRRAVRRRQRRRRGQPRRRPDGRAARRAARHRARRDRQPALRLGPGGGDPGARGRSPSATPTSSWPAASSR